MICGIWLNSELGLKISKNGAEDIYIVGLGGIDIGFRRAIEYIRSR